MLSEDRSFLKVFLRKKHILHQEREVLNMRAEEWRQIKGYPDYCVSSYGRIKSNRTKKEKYLKVCQNKDG